MASAGDIQIVFVIATALISFVAAAIQVRHDRLLRSPTKAEKERLRSLDSQRKWLTLVGASVGICTIPLTIVKGSENARLIAEANARAEEATARAEEARAATEKERLERVKLEERMKPSAHFAHRDHLFRGIVTTRFASSWSERSDAQAVQGS
jgi:hypothetical protein